VARRVTSVMTGPDPAVLEANTYAVAEDVDLTLVLRAAAVELAVAGAQTPPAELAGAALPLSQPAQDLRGLVESGVAVHIDAEALSARGLRPDELVTGTTVSDADTIADLMAAADAALVW
jgi:predicted peroxiredoxin